MNEQQFVYWLQGFAELQPEPPTKEQWQSIREHLATVFNKKTPPVGAPKVDVPKVSDLQELFKKSVRRDFYDDALPRPHYWLNPTIKPGDLVC